MNTTQIQLKISLSDRLNELLTSKATLVGLPVTQLVKYLIIKEVKDLEHPLFQMSENTEKRTRQAIKQISQAIDASDFFKQLNES